MRLTLPLAFCAILSFAQNSATSTADPLTNDAKSVWTTIKGYISKSAEKMPEEHYSFRPAETVRTFGEIVGHIADGHFMICGAEKGEKKQAGIEKSKKTKAELIAALNESIAYCESSFDSMNDKRAVEVIKFFGRDRARVSVLQFNNSHDYEHYGNLVTYMRIKGLVPPSSEPRR